MEEEKTRRKAATGSLLRRERLSRKRRLNEVPTCAFRWHIVPSERAGGEPMVNRVDLHEKTCALRHESKTRACCTPKARTLHAFKWWGSTPQKGKREPLPYVYKSIRGPGTTHDFIGKRANTRREELQKLVAWPASDGVTTLRPNPWGEWSKTQRVKTKPHNNTFCREQCCQPRKARDCPPRTRSTQTRQRKQQQRLMPHALD